MFKSAFNFPALGSAMQRWPDTKLDRRGIGVPLTAEVETRGSGAHWKKDGQATAWARNRYDPRDLQPTNAALRHERLNT